MSLQTGPESAPHPPSATADGEAREGGLLAAMVAGAGFLAVVGLLVFWPSDDEAPDGDPRRPSGAQGAAAAHPPSEETQKARGRGGIAPQSVDDPRPARSASVGRVNPALVGAVHGTIETSVPADPTPPEFDRVEDEIAWYERRLETARRDQSRRTQFVDRLPRARQRAEDSPNREAALARHESDADIVRANLDRAEAKVRQLEAKLAELRNR